MRPVKMMVASALGAAVLLAAMGLGAAPAPLKTSEFGSGPTIVLVHGLGGSGLTWMPTARKLLADHHVVMVDLPGHGESPLPDPFSLDAVADALDGVLARQPQRALVVGHGLGGLVALAELRRHPEHVGALVIIDASARFTVPVADQQQKMFLDYIDQNYDAFLRQMFTSLGRDSAQGVAIHAQASQVSKLAMTSYMRALLNTDESAALKSPKVPVLYIGSARAWPDSVSWADQAKARGFPAGAEIAARRIGASGYWVMRDQPDSLAAVLAAFAKQNLAPMAADR